MDDHVRAERALSFGQIAEQYDRWRPGYPEQLYTDVLAAGTGYLILEAGAGTGRATLALAERGAIVTAIEPDLDMAEIARSRTSGHRVRVLNAKFEDTDPNLGQFDIVAAAQSWHWIDPTQGNAAATAALKNGGALCLWWNRTGALTGPVWDRIRDAYTRIAPELPPPGTKQEQQAKSTPVQRIPGFTPWTKRTYEWSHRYTAHSFCALVGTYSDHIRLGADQRDQLLTAVQKIITATGTLDHPYRTELITAKREI